MKKIFIIILVISVFLSLGLKPEEYRIYVESDNPIGEVAFHLLDDDTYYCICEPEEITPDSVVISKIVNGQKPGLFHTYDEVNAELEKLATDYPEKCQMLTVGSSFEGREINALRFYPGSPSPGFLFVGTHHAREWMSTEIPLELCHYLSKNPDSDPRVDEWLSKFDIWIIPMLNPDGHQFTVDHDRMWRKNRKPVGMTGETGVDLNRNYGYHWGGEGASGDPSSIVYHGEGPFSELETQVIKKLVQEFPMIGCLTYHTFGELVLYPWSYASERAPYEELMQEHAIGLAEKTGEPDDEEDKNSKHEFAGKYDYLPIKASELYCASGEMCDYLYSQHGTASFTIEVGCKKDGFTPEDSLIEPTIDQLLDLNFYMLDEIPKDFCIVEGFIKTAIGTVPDAKIYLGKSYFEIEPDPFTGYYFRVLPIGKHLLKAEWTKDDTHREMVELTEGINRIDLTWVREDGLTLSGDILDETGEPSKTHITLIDSNGTTVSEGFFEGEYTFSNLNKDEYTLIASQPETPPVSYNVSLVWDLSVPVMVKGVFGY